MKKIIKVESTIQGLNPNKAGKGNIYRTGVFFIFIGLSL
jgi:hypothetical protein